MIIWQLSAVAANQKTIDYGQRILDDLGGEIDAKIRMSICLKTDYCYDIDEEIDPYKVNIR